MKVKSTIPAAFNFNGESYAPNQEFELQREDLKHPGIKRAIEAGQLVEVTKTKEEPPPA